MKLILYRVTVEPIIHDCWASYLSYNHCEHGLCGSHIISKLTCIIESNQYKWAINMKSLLLETCKDVSKRKKKKLSQKQYANLQKRYEILLHLVKVSYL